VSPAIFLSVDLTIEDDVVREAGVEALLFLQHAMRWLVAKSNKIKYVFSIPKSNILVGTDHKKKKINGICRKKGIFWFDNGIGLFNNKL
jgi:hypothetical protein